MGNGLDKAASSPAERLVEGGWKKMELDLMLKDQQRKLEGTQLAETFYPIVSTSGDFTGSNN